MYVLSEIKGEIGDSALACVPSLPKLKLIQTHVQVVYLTVSPGSMKEVMGK